VRSTWTPPFTVLSNPKIEYNIGDKESSSDLETGAEPHRLELEEEFGWRSQQDFGTLYPLFNSPENLQGLIFNAMFRRKKSKS
tara:strand:+ start:145 stop:393 length:249 start_codon:yes stop_codon:yes gene_type:complete